MSELIDPKKWDIPLFPIAVAAQAARVAPNTMRMWFDRKRVSLTEYDSPSSRENPARLLTLRSVLALAVTADLSRGSGSDVSLALKQARLWTDYSHSARLNGVDYAAVAAGLFDGDNIMTVLVHHGEDWSQIVPVNIGMEDVQGLKFDLLFPSRYPVYAMPRLLLLNSIDQYVRGVCEGYLREGSNA